MRELYLDDRGLKMSRLTEPAAGTATSGFRAPAARGDDSGEFAAAADAAADATLTTTAPSPMPPSSHTMPAPVQSAEQIRKSLEGKQVCPFCGTTDESDGGTAAGPCPRCTMENTPATRKATKERIGPWYVLQGRNPAAPGMRFETLLSFVRKGRVKPRSVVRGPTTHQLWRFAAQVKGLSREFGVCFSCGDSVDPDTSRCPHCGQGQEPPPNPDALLESSPDAQAAPTPPAWPADFGEDPAPPARVPAGTREPRLDDDLGPGGAPAAAADIVIPALSGSDESLSGFRVSPPPDDSAVGAAVVTPPTARPSPAPQPRPAAPAPPPAAPIAAPGPTPAAAAPRPAPAARPAAPSPPRRGPVAENTGGGFLSPKDLAAAFKLNFDPKADYAGAPSGGMPPDLAAEANDFFERGSRVPAARTPRGRRKGRWVRRLFFLFLIAAAGFAALLYADPVFRLRARLWSWDKWVWLRDNVLTSRDVDLETHQPVPPKSGSKAPASSQQKHPAGDKSGSTPEDGSKDGYDASVEDLVNPGAVSPTAPAGRSNAATQPGAAARRAAQPATGPDSTEPPPVFTPEMFAGERDAPAATAGASTNRAVAGNAPPPASAPSAAPDPKRQEQEMWRLYRAGVAAEGQGDPAAAARNYEQIKQQLPQSLWPADLDVRLSRVKKQIQNQQKS